jgi:general secretion pathway protein G
MASRRFPARGTRRPRGFTLIELVVVLSIVALLLMLVAPRYFGAIERSQATVQEHNIQTIRVAIDQFYADRARYPDSLDELVELRYLRQLPVNPQTEATDWAIVAPPAGQPGAVFDVQVAKPGGPDGAASEPAR